MENTKELFLSNLKFSDLYLCFCGYAKCDPLHSYGPAVRPNYLIHYISSGCGTYCSNHQTYHLQAGQGFLITPETQVFYQADENDPWQYFWIGFNGKHAREYLQVLGLNEHQPVFSCNKKKELEKIVLDIMEHNTFTTENMLFQQSLLYSFLATLAQDFDIPLSSVQRHGNLYVKKAEEFIQNNYYNPIHVTDVANYVCINRSYLYTLFKKYLNITPQEYLTDYRIVRATELLVTTDLSIDSVALSCGYQDSLVFSKVFKSKKGITPSQYRKARRLESGITYRKD